jgi:hypothetical protein
MPTITDTGFRHRAARLLAGCGLALAAWFVIVAVATRLLPWAGPVVAVGPAGDLRGVLASAPVQLLETGRGYMIVRGTGVPFVGHMYRAGAWLVLPAPAGGCLGSRRFLAQASPR